MTTFKKLKTQDFFRKEIASIFFPTQSDAMTRFSNTSMSRIKMVGIVSI